MGKKINEIIAGLDIGSNSVKFVAGQLPTVMPDKQLLNIIGAVSLPSAGISKGSVISIEDASNIISDALDKLERMIGHPIENVWVGISGPHIVSQKSKGVVAVSRTDGEITDDDVERAIDAARSISTPSNYEILHVVPRRFSIDGQTEIKDPVGMSGIRLEVDTQIIEGLSAQVKNLTKAVYRTGLDIEDVVLSVLAASEVVLTNRQRELGSMVIDIGGATTSLIVYEDGDVLHTSVLPIGSDHITSDIAIGLRVSIDTAERIKLEYGMANPGQIDKKEEIDLSTIDRLEEQMVSRKYIASIIEARVEEIFEKVDQELIKIDRSGMLPAGAVMIGGGAKLPGIVEVAKRKLRLPVSLGSLQGVTSSIDKVNDLAYMTAVGLVAWGEKMIPDASANRLSLSQFKRVADVSHKINKWFKSLFP